jgi:lipoyl(octanoyl) transferase
MPIHPVSPWRLLTTAPATGARNMALDEALMERARRTGEWVFRVYGWSSPSLSLGRNQSARGAYDLQAIEARGLSVVRRPTGGRAILHHREVTYSVTGPELGAGSMRAAYGRINRILERGLELLRVEVSIAPLNAPIPLPGLSPCFDLPAGGEIVAGGRKLAGSAQWRHSGAILQHGSILVEGDQRLVSELLLEPLPPPPRPATLAELLGRTPSLDEVAGALFTAVREFEDPRAALLPEPEPWLADDAASLERRYQDEAWTWRR